MTSKQINELKVTLLKSDSWTEKERKLYSELLCRKMINSCLAYESDFLNSSYSKDYIGELGELRVKELYKEQLEYFNSCILIYGIFEDDEGVTYNTLIEPEEDGYIHCEVIQEPILNKIEETNETYFSIKIKNKEGLSADIGLSSKVDNDYSNYYEGRKIGLKVVKSDIGIYKAVDVKFYEKNNEIEI